jgi:mannosyltransferase
MLEGTLTQEGGAAADVHPLLYYTLLHVWMGLVGQSPQAVRALSVLAGVLTVAMVFRLAADLFDRRVATLATLVTALAPFHIQYSQEARMYALMALWLTLATWCFVKGWRAGARRAVPAWRGWPWWAAFAVLAALSMYTQQLSAFYLAALALFPAVLGRWDVFKRVAAAGVAALALYLPWLIHLPQQVGKISQAYWLPRPGLAQAAQTLFALTVPLLELPQWILVGGLLAAMLLVVFLALRAYHARRAVGLVLWLAFAPPALMIVIGQLLPVYLPRALLPCVLMFYVGAGWLFARGGMPRVVVGGLTALWIVVGGAGLLQHYQWDSFPNSPFDRVAAYLNRTRRPGDVIVHSNKLTFLPMVYYDRELPQTFVADPPGSPQDTLAPATQRVLGLIEQPCVEEAVRGAERVWFVSFRREVEEAGGAEGTALGWMQAHFNHAGLTLRFNDLDVYPFTEPHAAARAGECSP